MILAAKIILCPGDVPVSTVFQTAFPTVTYHSSNAKKQLLAMPVVIFKVECTHRLYVIEKIQGVSHYHLVEYIKKLAKLHVPEKQIISKEMV